MWWCVLAAAAALKLPNRSLLYGNLRHEGNSRLGACHHHHHHHHQTIVCLESVQSAVTADFAYQRHFCSMQIIRMKLCKMVNAFFFSLITIAFFCTFFFVRLISSIMCVLEVYFWCSSDITTVHCRGVSTVIELHCHCCFTWTAFRQAKKSNNLCPYLNTLEPLTQFG